MWITCFALPDDTRIAGVTDHRKMGKTDHGALKKMRQDFEYRFNSPQVSCENTVLIISFSDIF